MRSSGQLRLVIFAAVLLFVCCSLYIQLSLRRHISRPVIAAVNPPLPPLALSSSSYPSFSQSFSREAPQNWRERDWESYPVIETYKLVAPRVDVRHPCKDGLAFCDRIAQYKILHYPNYRVLTPGFGDEESRQLWLSGFQKSFPKLVRSTRSCVERQVDICLQNSTFSDWQEGIIFDREPETRGEIMTFTNATTIDALHEWAKCGSLFRHWTEIIPRPLEDNVVDEAFVFKVPGCHEFQHFLDGSFPKLMQWLDFMDLKKTVLLMVDQPATRFMCDLPKQQNLPSLCNIDTQFVSARRLHFGCYTPTLHPYHWRRMQTFVGVRDVPLHERNLIIYATRSGGHAQRANNREARLVVNDDQVRDLITSHFERRNQGEEVLIYYSENYTPMENLRIWNSARAVIGPHGGALYNSFFCLPGTMLVEFMDIVAGAIPSNHLVPHKAANFLGLNYYTIPIKTTRDFDVPLDNLQAILDLEFPIA